MVNRLPKIKMLPLQTEEKTRESLVLSLEDIPLAAIEWDESARVRSWNTAASRLFGLHREEAPGKTCKELILQEYQQKAFENLWQSGSGYDEIQTGVYHYRQVGGRIVLLKWVNKIFRDEKASVVKVLSLVQDITEAHQVEKRQQALFRISEAAFSTRELKELYRSVHAILAELLPAQNFYIALYNEKKNTVNFPYLIDEYDQEAPQEMSLSDQAPGRGLTAYLLRKGEPLLIDQAAFKALLAEGEVELIGSMPIEWLGIPLKTGTGAIIGALVVQSYHEEIRYRQEDIDILTFVSTQIATAIERLRAEEETEHYINRLKAMRAIDQAILSSPSPQSIAAASLQPIQSLLPCQMAMVMLLNLPHQQMQPLAYLLEDRIQAWTETSADYFQYVIPSVKRGEVIHVKSLASMAEPNFLNRHIRQFGIDSYLGLPLRCSGEVIGYLFVGSKYENAFLAEHIEIASEVSNSLAVGLQNARLYQETVSLLWREQRLNEISRILTSTFDTAEIYRTVTRLAVELIGFDAGVLSLISDEGDSLKIAALYHLPQPLEHTVIPRGQGLTWKVIEKGEIDYIPDYSLNPDALPQAAAAGAKSLLVVPLIYKGEKQGALSVFSYKAHQPLMPADMALANAIAQQVANAIQNARLFENVQQLAITDSLTGLFNRRHFFQIAQREFNQAMRYNRDLSMVMIDLDHFKRVNDTYGHPAGDWVLQEIARRMNGALRDTDLLGRYGGEEFVILLQETGLEQAKIIAERLRLNIAVSPLTLPASGQKVQITASLGVSEIDEECLSLQQLIDRADLALYRAKQNGRNQVCVLGNDG